MVYEGGVREFVKYLDRSKTAMIPDPIYINGVKDDIGVEVAMWWNDSYHENVLPFTNNIPQRDGGTHMAGFRGALTRTINNFATSVGHREEGKGKLHRRRCPRRPDLRVVRKSSRSKVLFPNQRQACVIRSTACR